MKKKFAAVSAILALLLVIYIPSAQAAGFHIIDAKTCRSVDKNRDPLEIISEFPAGTETVYCWFSWENALPGSTLKALWYFETQKTHILDYPMKLSVAAEHGACSLHMPEGHPFLPGNYRLNFVMDGKIVRSVNFKVLLADSKA